MPVNHSELMSVLAQLADDRNIRAAVSGSLKGAALTGAATFIGGLIFGPMGLAVGGIAGGLTAASASRNSFRPVAQIIMEDMTASQKAVLAARVTNVLRDFAVTDLALLLPLIQGNPRLGEAVVLALVNYLRNEMNLSIA